jgi:predicted HAD superfamily phosphohydrolase
MKEDTYIYKKENCDIDSVIKLSEKMRKEVRGQVVGSLG